MKAAFPSSRLFPFVPVPDLPQRHMMRPHLLTKKQVTSTARSRSTNATTRIPAQRIMFIERAVSSSKSVETRKRALNRKSRSQFRTKTNKQMKPKSTTFVTLTSNTSTRQKRTHLPQCEHWHALVSSAFLMLRQVCALVSHYILRRTWAQS